MDTLDGHGITRRTALTAAGGFLALPLGGAIAAAIPAAVSSHRSAAGWENRPMRWAQLAFVEDDPGNFDPAMWLDYFRRSEVQAVTLSAGGVVAFYPTDIPLHTRAPGIDRMDAFGAMVAGCRAQGIDVVARIEPYGCRDDVASAHPEWLARGTDGKPVRSPTADLWMTCALGGYNFVFMNSVVKEIATRYRPDAFFGNRWMPQMMCYCDSCRTLFRAASGMEIPAGFLTGDAASRAYRDWESKRLLELVALWTRTMTRTNPQSFFIPNGAGRAQSLDLKTYAVRSRLMGTDNQGRTGTVPPWASGADAKRLRAAMDMKPIFGIFGIGLEAPHRWKDSVTSNAEIRAWVAGSVAQGGRPWLVKFNAKPIDRRWMPEVAAIYGELKRNEPYLRNTRNLARVAIVTADRPAEEFERGWYQALVEARIPFEMVLDNRLDEPTLDRFRVLVMPNVSKLSDAACRAIEAFVKRGGRVVASFETSLYDEWGGRRADFGLADMFGCSVAGPASSRLQNSYLALDHPHPLTRGLAATPRIAGPVRRIPVTLHGESEVPISWIPTYTDLPMERVFTTVERSDVPMAICRSYGQGRVVFLPMDLDRTFWEVLAEDHGTVLRNAVEWAADEAPPARVTGKGLIDIAYWRQEKSLALHLVNLNNAMTMRGSFREAIPTGPFRVEIDIPSGVTVRSVRLLEQGWIVLAAYADGRLTVEVDSVASHEIVAIDLT